MSAAKLGTYCCVAVAKGLILGLITATLTFCPAWASYRRTSMSSITSSLAMRVVAILNTWSMRFLSEP